MEHQQTRVDNALTLQGCRADVINRLVDRCVGIEVGTELHTDTLTPRHNAQTLALTGEVLGTVEGHVFEEVCQSALTGLFKNAAYTLCNVEVGQPSLLGIVADIIGHTVLELSLANGGVLWQGLSYCRSRQQHQTYKRI